MFWLGKKKRAEKLLKSGDPRRIQIHSVISLEEEGCGGNRVAFEFLDPPGPWSVQFYEAAPGQEGVLADLEPGSQAVFYESEDGAKTRVLALSDGRALWPR